MQNAANSLDIDVNKKSTHHLKIDNINIPKEWNIGLIYVQEAQNNLAQTFIWR